MDKINNYAYPTLRTFKDALDLAQLALEKYAGVIPVADAARKLGYTINNPKSISGTIYKHINDICMYGLLTRDVRGALKTTPLAKEALDPFDKTKAALGKAKALRGIELIARAFDAWGGQIPDDTALPARLNELTGAEWTECKSKAEGIKIIINEAIPYLLLSKDVVGDVHMEAESPPQPEDRRDSMVKNETRQMGTTSTPSTISKQIGGIEEFVLGEGIRVYLPRDNIKVAWNKAKKALKVLIEESEDS